jgi:hypothetical protein
MAKEFQGVLHTCTFADQQNITKNNVKVGVLYWRK